jgi:hypothetical protein
MNPSPFITVFGMTFNIYAVILVVLGLVFVLALWNAQKYKGLDWTDMITRDGTKVSTTKILQLVGGVVGTWIIIQVTLGGSLTWDLFAIYLAYVASIDGFSKFVMARYGAEGSDDSRVPYRRSRGRIPIEDDCYDEPRRPVRRGASKEDEELDDPRPRGSSRTPE